MMLNGKRRKGKMIMNLKDSALGVEVSKASIRYNPDSRRYHLLPPVGKDNLLCYASANLRWKIDDTFFFLVDLIKTVCPRVNYTPLPIEPPEGAPSAHATSQITLKPGATISVEANQGKPIYAATVTTANQLANTPKHPKESVIARITTHNGIPAVIYKAKDYYAIMAEECRGSVKIGAYDNHNMFLDFTNEDDFNMVWFKRVIKKEGLQMWLQKWTPNFKPEEDIPIVPMWALLPGLFFHMHSWHYVKQIVNTIGTPLAKDQ
ncbi:hypothetical protein KY290_024900 [Solanum tuberosum]|uniref:DUF4283 domain-containing protein n=1 Tax=Solanum tuberosum TaxID=4113 RepID=A0ABQ7UV41_SOLTU|nr:hypothetical protein KY290_024900 [Solanum tuberosum]